LLRRCLAKDRQQRLQDIGDARIEISEALASPGDRATVAAGLPLAHRRLVPWALGVLVGMLIAGFALWNLKPSSPTVAQVPAQVAISLPPGDRLVTQNLPPIAVSPGGTYVAYVAIHEGIQQLLLRALDNREAKHIPGTEGASIFGDRRPNLEIDEIGRNWGHPILCFRFCHYTPA
jgi:eukaryotic-like serine/threonine-protein kinase